MENRCRKRATPEKCLKYYTARLEEGKDVVKLLEFHKLEKERKDKKEHQLKIVNIECLKRLLRLHGVLVSVPRLKQQDFCCCPGLVSHFGQDSRSPSTRIVRLSKLRHLHHY